MVDELEDGLEEDFEDETEDEVEDETEESEDESEESEDESEDESETKTPDKSEKRIRAMQSQLDKVIAENNKLKKAGPKNDKTPSDAAKRDPEVARWMAVARETARDRLYDSEPRLKEFGISADVIGGETPDEMKESMKELTKLITRVETRVRNKVLREHGFSPPPKESGAGPRVNYDKMDAKEFDRLVRENSGY